MKKNKTVLKDKNLFKRDTPLYLTIIFVFLSSIIVYSFFPHPAEERDVVVIPPKKDCIPELNFIRSKDNKFSHRVLLSGAADENPKLASIKQRVDQFITQKKSSNAVSNVSVYYRRLNSGDWFEINGDRTFVPASLIKVVSMITLLKQAENDPDLLNTKLYFEKHLELGYSQGIKDFSLKEKKYYTVKELLFYMIAHSDNEAAALLMPKMNKDIYYKLYKDLEITPPDPNRAKGVEFSMSVIDYCKFFRVLYNSSYLKEEYSEFALQLLTQSSFKDGLLKNITTNFTIAHKFGERAMGNIQELHEVGIFYVDRRPYMLGVMSEGSDMNQLAELLGRISDIVYEESVKLD